MEIALFGLMRPMIGSESGLSVTRKKLQEVSYYEAFRCWMPRVVEEPIDFDEEPFRSTEILRKKRNRAVHRNSEAAAAPTARAGLCSAVEGCKELYRLFGRDFEYKKCLRERPLGDERWISQVRTI